jgi:ribosome-binding factor A
MQHREERVGDAICEAVAAIIVNELSDPKIGFVTVTRCHMTRDLRIATVYLSVLGTDAERKQTIEHVRHAAAYIRRQLPRFVKLRYLPELRFERDQILAHERRVNELLGEVYPDGPPPPEPEPGAAEDAGPEPGD